MDVSNIGMQLMYQGKPIRRNRQQMVCLTDMWRAVGKPKNQDPPQWMRLDTTSTLIKFLESNMGFSHVWKSGAGNRGGTWAIQNLAVAYAEYLSPPFHAWAIETILERIRCEQAETTHRERQMMRWLRKGRDAAWIQQRIEGIMTRNSFTDTLKSAGVHDAGYPACTDAVYEKLLGRKARDEKLVRELPKSANLRDHLTAHETVAVSFAESLAERQIANNNLSGNYLCKVACETSATVVRQAIEQIECKPGKITQRRTEAP